MTSKTPSNPDPLEITITHCPPLTPEQVRHFFDERLIMIGTAGFGVDRAAYPAHLVNDFDCMEWLRLHGGAVIANYPGVLKTGERVIGWAGPAKALERYAWAPGKEPLFGLRLSRSRIVNVADVGLTNLSPRSRAIQTCHERAKGRLIEAVRSGR